MPNAANGHDNLATWYALTNTVRIVRMIFKDAKRTYFLGFARVMAGNCTHGPDFPLNISLHPINTWILSG